jgi:hypothetical protein
VGAGAAAAGRCAPVGRTAVVPTYRVELRGEARELFTVKADSPEEARERWAEGSSYLLEASSMEVVSVELDD